MKITPEVLEQLGAKKYSPRRWTLILHGYQFFFHAVGQFWYFGRKKRYTHCHCVTDVEECISFAFADGLAESGSD